jgi:hypothetical protein
MRLQIDFSVWKEADNIERGRLMVERIKTGLKTINNKKISVETIHKLIARLDETWEKLDKNLLNS